MITLAKSRWVARVAQLVVAFGLALPALSAPAAAQSTVLFCVSDASIVRVEFSPGGSNVYLNDLFLPAAPGIDPSTPGPFVTRVGDTVMDYELVRQGGGWALRTTSVRLPAGTASASVGRCRSVTALDIAPRIPAAEREPVAVVFVIDRSGSMSAAAGGADMATRLDVAKLATIGAARLLGPGSRVGIVLFDSASYVLVPLQETVDLAAIETALEPVVPGGGTNIYPGLEQALNMLADIDTPSRHILIVTDGITAAADFMPLINIARDGGITVSTIGVGGGSYDRRLADIARLGGGQYHPATDIRALPSLMEADLVALLATPRPEPVAAEGPVVLVPAVFTAEQAAAGADAYATNCAGCHGADLVTGFAPHLAGTNFEHWFNDPVSALWEKITTTMPMGNAGGLDDETYGNIVAYILQQNGFNPGTQPLPTETGELGRMGFIKAAVPDSDITLAFEDVGNPALLAAIANGDVAVGEAAAMQCAGCHSLAEGEANRFGPNLFGIVYREVGTHEGFTYSPALAALGQQGAVWTYAGLDAFLTSPQAATPGTTMPFGGIADASERANLIAYLRSLARPAAGVPVSDADLIALIRASVARCWSPPLGWTNPADVRVTVQFGLNPNGTVRGLVQVVERPNSAIGQAAADSAQRAVYVCGPYVLPAEAYDRWQNVRLTFDPVDMF